MIVLALLLTAPAYWPALNARSPQASYGEAASALGDGINLRSPKKECPCIDNLTHCPCDGVGAPSWFPPTKPLEVGHEDSKAHRRTSSPGRIKQPSGPGTTPARISQDTPRVPQESGLPPTTPDFSQRGTPSSGSWFTSASVKLKLAPLRMTLDVEPGGTFDADRLNTFGSPVSPPGSGGGGGIPPGPVPVPPPPGPTSTKPGSLWGDGNDSDGSDAPFLIGPEVAVPLKEDVTEWAFLRWLPDSSSLTLYGHVLVGDLEIFDTTVDVELYGLGLGLAVPLLRADPLGVALIFAAGPGFLRTDLGDTAGVQAATGLQVTLGLTRGLSFVASMDLLGFFAPDVRAWGPVANLGLSLAW